MKRFFFALRQGFRYRQAVGRVFHSSHQAIPTVCTLEPEDLQSLGVKHLALDFDGVLAAHGEALPALAVEQWLKGFCQAWPEGNISLLSNKPLPARIAYFQTHFPDMHFVTGFPKKPYPDGLLHIAERNELSPAQVALVDDRLLTGILAACLAGAKGIYIQKPYRRLWRRPVRELFFSGLRALERGIWWRIGRLG